MLMKSDIVIRFQRAAVPKADMAFTAATIKTYGCVCRLNNISMSAKHRCASGAGRGPQRIKADHAAIEYLNSHWPKVFRPHPTRDAEVHLHSAVMLSPLKNIVKSATGAVVAKPFGNPADFLQRVRSYRSALPSGQSNAVKKGHLKERRKKRFQRDQNVYGSKRRAGRRPKSILKVKDRQPLSRALSKLREAALQPSRPIYCAQ